jgi:UDP-glucose 6-dehydrogenase
LENLTVNCEADIYQMDHLHDPMGIKRDTFFYNDKKNTKKIFGEKINYAKTVKDALSKSQCAIIMTHWKQYEKLNNNEFKYMTKKFVIDCRRVLVKKQLDVDYFAIGSGK